MDDSSCGFLGIAYDHLAAYTLGINEKAWTQIGDLVADSGPLTITMVWLALDQILYQCLWSSITEYFIIKSFQTQYLV